METIGVFGGSFNPVHNGHIALARQVLERGLADRLLFVLSPLNPLKEHPEALVPDSQRLEMLRSAIDGNPGMEVCDLELTMPRPSYTINTLQRLSEIYPHSQLRLLIGADNWQIFDKWKDYEEILQNYPPIVYPRPGYECNVAVDFELFDISSTQIREMINSGKDASSYLPAPVYEYIRNHGLYR